MSDVVDAAKREYYSDAIIDVARRQQPVSMKVDCRYSCISNELITSILSQAYHAVEWRYVLVVKQYCLHYLGESNTEYEPAVCLVFFTYISFRCAYRYTTYFPDSPVALYQNVWTLQEKVSHCGCHLAFVHVRTIDVYQYSTTIFKDKNPFHI